MAAGDIVINLVGQNALTPAVQGSIAALGGLDSALDRHMSRLVGHTRAQQAFNAMLDETSREQGRAVAISGKAQGAINQLIFAVDDAATSYGTGGLAGAIRGASNNLTMAASLMGPWGAAVAVGIAAVTQLGLAFSKTREETEQGTNALEEFRKTAQELSKTPFGLDPRERDRIYNPEQRSEDPRVNRINDERDAIRRQIADIDEKILELEAKREEFAISRSETPTTDVMGGLSEDDARTVLGMTGQIEQFRVRRGDLGLEEWNLARHAAARQQEFDQQQNAAAQERAVQEEEQRIKDAELREAREAYNELMARTAMQGALGRDLRERRKGPGGALLDRFGGSGQRLGDAVEGETWQLRAPSGAQAGSVEAARLVNMARLGGQKTGEERELMKLNTGMSTLIGIVRTRSQKDDEQAPEEILDF